MTSVLAVVCEPAQEAADRCEIVRDADTLIDWRTERANVTVDLSEMPAPAGLSAPALDLLDVAIGIYIADIAVMRGEREAWPREITLAIPVREPRLWSSIGRDLSRLIYALTRDSFTLHFYAVPDLSEMGYECAPASEERVDCVSMLSGGLDSLAGAVMLQETGRRPLYSMHRSGNPTVLTAQRNVVRSIQSHWPGGSHTAPCLVAPSSAGNDALAFPPAEQREPSRRARSLLFMALATVAAQAVSGNEVYMCENGLLTAGLPLSPSRTGSMSTRSTHPAAINLFNDIVARAGLDGLVVNPFVYETKADLIRNILKPHLTPREIQATISCWAAGRGNRQCGGCIPCLLRRIGMAYAELPEEAYMIDVLGRPDEYVGTDAWGNLVDLLRHARRIAEQSDAELVAEQPAILALSAAGVEIGEIIAMLRRHANQTLGVVDECFPRAARLIG